jgi:hypothetical protein
MEERKKTDSSGQSNNKQADQKQSQKVSLNPKRINSRPKNQTTRKKTGMMISNQHQNLATELILKITSSHLKNQTARQ